MEIINKKLIHTIQEVGIHTSAVVLQVQTMSCVALYDSEYPSNFSASNRFPINAEQMRIVVVRRPWEFPKLCMQGRNSSFHEGKFDSDTAETKSAKNGTFT